MTTDFTFSKSLLSEQVEKALIAEILSGKVKPGQRIDLNAYRQLWSMSITPLRDAVRVLETAGLVEVSPRRGVFVSKLDGNSMKEIFEIRIALECMAVELATSRVPETEARDTLDAYLRARATKKGKSRKQLLDLVDLRIHDLCLKHCGNERLRRMMEGIRDLVILSQRTIVRMLNEPLETTLPEHIAIAEAVCARDAPRASRAMGAHLRSTLQRITTFLDSRVDE